MIEALLKSIWEKNMRLSCIGPGWIWCRQTGHPWRPEHTVCEHPECVEWSRIILGE